LTRRRRVGTRHAAMSPITAGTMTVRSSITRGE
jgi:hypothetical protein